MDLLVGGLELWVVAPDAIEIGLLEMFSATVSAERPCEPLSPRANQWRRRRRDRLASNDHHKNA